MATNCKLIVETLKEMNMEELMTTLHKEGHSLVVRTATGHTMAFDGRGIGDLMQLLDQRPDVLEGAELADKVVGKAAASLMIKGRIKAVCADIISEHALMLFASAAPGIGVAYANRVEHIANRANTDWCPMELACIDASTPDECVARIDAKLAELAKTKK